MTDFYERSAIIHEQLHGKIAVVSKIPIGSLDDLSIAYTPGVARPCELIAADPARARQLTIKGNSVAVVTDGSAVLGLGDIGPLAAIPVMEGKVLLFKEFANLEAWPICLDTKDVDEIVNTVRQIAPVFGGINLEDISAPRCFDIEERLQDIGIPVFHDDQHGTAIVTMAAVTNALRVVGKSIDQVKVVFSGAGAAGIACARMLMKAGVSDMILLDSKGAIYDGREDLTHAKRDIAKVTNREGVSGDIHTAIEGADVFVGLSGPDLMNRDDVKRMAKDAVVLAMANPTPEILPDEAKAGGAVVIGTGRSDFPNQVNNVLAFPGVFKGAMESRAPRVTAEMQLSAALALANLVGTPGIENILPAALDKTVAPAIAAAVSKSYAEFGAK